MADDDTAQNEDATPDGPPPNALLAELRGLSPAAHKGLLMLARYWWHRFRLQPRHAEPDDLLQEAVVRVLAERRRPPDGVKLEAFLSGVMQSIASHSVEKAKGSDDLHRDAIPLDQRPPIGDTVSPGGARPAATSESRFLARDSLNKIDDLLVDEPELRSLLALKAQGWKKAEIKAELGFDETKWEKLKKRAVRKLAGVERAGEMT